MDKAEIDKLWAAAVSGRAQPQYIMCAPTPYAMFQAYGQLQGRDWRRIKREMNKAAIKARKATRVRSAALDELGRLDGELMKAGGE